MRHFSLKTCAAAAVTIVMVSGCGVSESSIPAEPSAAQLASPSEAARLLEGQSSEELSVSSALYFFEEASSVVVHFAEDDEDMTLDAARDYATSYGVPVLHYQDGAALKDGLAELSAEYVFTLEELSNDQKKDIEKQLELPIVRVDQDDLISIPQSSARALEANPAGLVAVIGLATHDDVLAANAQAAGAVIHTVQDGQDLRQDADLLSYGTEDMSFVAGTPDTGFRQIEWMLATIATGVALPGGGQLVFDDKRYIALYGSPATTALGILGEQGVEETIDLAEEFASRYDALFDETVVPALEIIVTVASASEGNSGQYSNEWSPKTFVPLIEAAAEAGQYVVLDFQPGRSTFPDQIKKYEQLLSYPHVGVALDPEWRIGPNEKHLTRIGHVEAVEVNEVIDYVADFTRENDLPQKAVVLHQFQTQMLRDRDMINTSREEVAVLIHADGQGTQSEKQGTWQNLIFDAPENIYWGWKNFIDEDHPMLSEEATSKIEPTPHFISYQ